VSFVVKNLSATPAIVCVSIYANLLTAYDSRSCFRHAQRAQNPRRAPRSGKDYNHRFGDVVFFLESTGWRKRTTGGHHIFTRPGLPVLINLQPEKSGRAKAYQIRQVRTVLINHKL